MNNSFITSKSLFALFALFVIFSDEIFYSYVSLAGLSLEAGLKSREAIVIAVLGYVLIFADMARGKLSGRNYKQLLLMAVLLLMYFMTGVYYSGTGKTANYTSNMLAFGAICIPSCYVGMRLARRIYDEQILKLLPFFIILVSITVGYAVVFSSLQGALLTAEGEDVFNYQSASYYLSSCCVYSIFYVFYSDKGKSFLERLLYLIELLLIFYCAIGCVISGGRGGFVYLVVVAIYLIYRLIKKGKSSKTSHYFFMIVVAFVVMAYLITHLNIFESSGAIRITENLTTDDNRTHLWTEAMKVFEESPIIGHGLGSIWWTVGYYSHNMLVDLLAELGLVGACVVITIIVRMLLCMVKQSYTNIFDMFMLLLFLGTLIEDTFSGYWFSSFKLYLLFGYVYGFAKNRQRHYRIRTINNKKDY